MELGAAIEEGREIIEQKKAKKARELLLTLKDGREISEVEFKQLTPYCSMGIVHIGISSKTNVLQAKLTGSGKILLGVE